MDLHLESNANNLQRIRDSIAYLQSMKYHMAQSAGKERALLGIKPFWKRLTLKLTLRWERWQIMLKLAILAKEGISIDTLREDPPDEIFWTDFIENIKNQVF